MNAKKQSIRKQMHERKITLAFIFREQHYALFIETIVSSTQNSINLNNKMGSFTKAALKAFNAVVSAESLPSQKKRELLLKYFSS